MKTAYCTFIIVLLAASALFTQTALGKRQPELHNDPRGRISRSLSPPHLSSQAFDIAAGDQGNSQVVIQATNRISIPFGIAPILPLYDNGGKVLVSGHGGCTKDETVSVVITVTQTTGASAVGQTEETCTGLLQHWTLMATATTANLEATEAEACGAAVTYSNDSITDTFEWCRSVALASLHYYLPIILVEP